MRMNFHLTLLATCLTLVHGTVCSADNFEWETDNTTSNWNSAANWGGTLGHFPDDNTDAALIGPGGLNPKLNAGNVTIGTLYLHGGAELSTGNFALTVQSSNSQSGSTGILDPLTRLTVLPSPVANDFDTDFLYINEGTLFLDQGAKAQVDGQLVTSDGGSIAGNGVLELNGSENFISSGELRAAGGTLTIQRTSTARIDLDGDGSGALIADQNSQLIVDLPNTGSNFAGGMSISQDGEIRINDNWILLTEIDFNGGSGTATQSGNRTTYRGTVNVNSGTAVFAAAQTTFSGPALVEVAPRTTIQFDGPTTIEHPNILSVGFQPTFVVNNTVTIGQGNGNFDWDGLIQNGVVDGRTTVNPGGELLIDVDRIDAANPNRYDGRLTINSGLVDVQTSLGQWEMAGLMNLSNTTGSSTDNLSGDEVLVTGNVVVDGNGDSIISAPIIFGADSHVDVRSGAVLRLEGDTLMNGGSWTGDGIVDLRAATRVATPTTIDMPNGTFDLTLIKNGLPIPGSLTLDDVLTINAASLRADTSNAIRSDITINGAAGRLDVRLTDPQASYRIEQGGEIILNGPSGGLTGLHLTGSDMILDAQMRVNGNSTSQARIDFESRAFVDVSADATLSLASGTQASPNVIRAGAEFQGDGWLVVPTGGHLALDNGAAANVIVLVDGTLQIGTTAPAIATVGTIQVEPSGTIQLNIDGTTVGSEYDQLVGDGFLLGTIEFLVNELGGSYADPVLPGAFDEFLFFDGQPLFVTAERLVYDGVELNPLSIAPGRLIHHSGDGLFRNLHLADAEYRLINYRALPGDADGDGVVDGNDFLIWNEHKFTSGTDWLTGDFNGDGVTDGADFLLWNEYKFTSVDFGGTLVPEPTSAMCLVGFVGFFMLRTRRAA